MKNIILSILLVTFTIGFTNAQSKKVQTKFSIDKIVTNYLALKNALTKDETKAVASAGKTLYDTFNDV